jgi:AraC-like DNA-binding protein
VAAKTGLLFTLRQGPVISAMLRRKGVDAAPLLLETGLPLDTLRGEITAPLPRVQAFMQRVADALGTDQLGIAVAEAMPSGFFGVVEFLLRSAPTLADSLRALCEYASLINPIVILRFIDHGHEGCLHNAVASQRDTAGRHINEAGLAYIVRQFKETLGTALPLERIWFSHARETGTEAIAGYFGCPVRFQAPDCGFAMSRAVLDIVPRTADPLLHKFMQEQARAQLARAGELDIVTHLVRVLETRLRTSELGADDVARAMAITPRTLQRHLVDAGTSFREVLAHVRTRRRAELLVSGMNEGEIAAYLGFSDVRAMRRSLDE